MRMKLLFALALVFTVASVSAVPAAEWGLKKGNVELKSAGPLAFAPDGILLIGDTKSAAVVAVDTGEKTGEPSKAKINVKDLSAQLAKALGGATTLNDIAVNPASGTAYLSVAVAGKPAIATIDSAGKISKVNLSGVPFASVNLPNAPEDKVTGSGRRQGNARNDSITDLAFSEGKVLVSGVSPNPDGGRPLSTVREIPFPFTSADNGVNVEIYHGAHGKFENYSTVRTFVPFTIDGKPSVLAGFTCTPLVRFDLKQFEENAKKVRGTTVAELGNRNRPYDMIVYKKDGKSFLLMANSARGVMKISTDEIGRAKGITERVSGGGVAGQEYETIESLKDVIQLDRLNDTHALILVKNDSGTQDLTTVELP